MPRLCRDQARDELLLIAGGGVAAGVIPFPGVFVPAMTVVQVALVNRVAQIYGFDVIASGGAAALAGAIMGGGMGSFLENMVGEVIGRLPGIGPFVKPAIGAGATLSFGAAAIAYFEAMYPNKIYCDDDQPQSAPPVATPTPEN